jgi:hypothetical protein
VALNRAGPTAPIEHVEELFGAPVIAIPESASVPRSTAAGLPAGTGDEAVRDAIATLAARVQSSLRNST